MTKQYICVEDINTYKYLNSNELNSDNIINKVIFIYSLGKMGILKKLITIMEGGDNPEEDS